MKRTLLTALVVLWCVQPALAEDPALKQLKGEPGYVDLSKIKAPKEAGEAAEITIGPDLLKAMMSSLPDSAGLPPGLIDGIRGIQVRAFDAIGESSQELRNSAESIANELQNKGWSRMIRVADGDELVTIDIKYHDGAMAGLMIMALEEDEVAIVNLVGSLNLASILQMASQGLNPAVLDSLQKAIEQATTQK